MSQFKKNPEFVDKVCNTCKNTYQISFYKRKTSVYCSKKCANANEDVLTKMRTSQKKTYDEKYNGILIYNILKKIVDVFYNLFNDKLKEIKKHNEFKENEYNSYNSFNSLQFSSLIKLLDIGRWVC